MTLASLLDEAVGRAPDAPAVVWDGGVLTFAGLDARVDRLARWLVSRGVGPGVPVALVLDRSLDLVVAIHAVLRAGGAYVPVDRAQPVVRRQRVLDDCRPGVTLTDAVLRELAGVRGPALGDAAPAATARRLVSPARPNDRAYIIYTSGSTGQPKGVEVEHASALNFLRAIHAPLPCGPGKTYLFKTNHAFDVSLMELFGPLLGGGRLAILPTGDERDPAAIARTIERDAVTHACFVPSQLQAFLDHGGMRDQAALAGVEALWVAGEPFGRLLGERARAALPNARIWNFYGPTEAAIGVTAFELTGHVETPTWPIGRALPNVDLRLVYPDDSTLRPVERGGEGELLIGGLQLARGYLNQPDLTAERFVRDPACRSADDGGRWYRTGDICRERADGTLVFLGRRDGQVKIRGHRVELAEVECHLVNSPAIADAAVVAVEAATGERVLAAYVVARDVGAPPTPRQLREHLARTLPSYMIPSAWCAIDAFPLTASGKRDLGALPPVAAQATIAGLSPPTNSPSRPVEDAVAAIWAAELGVGRVASEDDFFMCGGHSLAAARVVSAVRVSLGKAVEVGDLYQAPVFGVFAARVAAASSVAPHADDTTAAAATGVHPLTHQQFGQWLLERAGVPYLNVVTRRRVGVRLDAARLEAALSAVVAAHPGLRCGVGRWVPRITFEPFARARVEQGEVQQVTNATLDASLEELARHWTWHDGEAAVRVRLFHLDDRTSEVQVAMSHIVSDEVSISTVCDDLSAAYERQRSGPPARLDGGGAYSAIVERERSSTAQALADSTGFWERYGADVDPIVFPSGEMLPRGERYSPLVLTWPARALDGLRRVSAREHLGLADLIQACVLAAVGPHLCGAPLTSGPRRIQMSTPVSTRTSAGHRRTIGLFARYDVLKVDVGGAMGGGRPASTLELARRVRRAKLETEQHQACPYSVKATAAFGRRWRRRMVGELATRAAARALLTLYRSARLDPHVVRAKMRLIGLTAMGRMPGVTLSVNVMHQFLFPSSRELFGVPVLATSRTPILQPPARRVLDVSFQREHGGGGEALLVLTGDLTSSFREQLGVAILQAAVAFDSEMTAGSGS